eukprot:124095_1
MLRIKIDGDITWNLSQYNDESGYFKIIISPDVQLKLKNYHKYLPPIQELHIETYWKDCFQNIMKQLFKTQGYGSIKYELKQNYGRIFIDKGHKLLLVQYENNIHSLKLPYCCIGGCGCYEPRDNQSGQRIKMQIMRQLNHIDHNITQQNQIWKIKHSSNNKIITLDPSNGNDIAKLWNNNILLLSLISPENDIYMSKFQLPSKYDINDLKVEYFVSIDFGSSEIGVAYCPVESNPLHMKLMTQCSSEDKRSHKLTALLIDKGTQNVQSTGYDAEELYYREEHKYMYFENFLQYLYKVPLTPVNVRQLFDGYIRKCIKSQSMVTFIPNDIIDLIILFVGCIKTKHKLRHYLEKNVLIESADKHSTLPLLDLMTLSFNSVVSDVIHHINDFRSIVGTTLIDKNKIFWILSIPGIYDEMSKEMIKYCANKIEIIHYELCLASIAATFDLLNGFHGNICKWKTNDKVIVLDCGASKIDAACIKIESVSFDISEIHGTLGIEGGSLNIDNEFMDLLTELLPNDIIDAVKGTPDWTRQTQEFVLAKMSCPLDLGDDPWNVPFTFGIHKLLSKLKRKKKRKEYKQIAKHIEEYKIADYIQESNNNNTMKQVGQSFKLGRSNLKIYKNGWLHLHEKLFRKIIYFLRQLLKNSDLSDCNKIVIVGGLANSDFLLDRLMKEFPNIKIFKPRRPQLTATKGALYWISNRTKLRTLRSKCSYGIELNKHNTNLTTKQFEVFIMKNESIIDGYTKDFVHWIRPCVQQAEICLYALDSQLNKNVQSDACFVVKTFVIPIQNLSQKTIQFPIKMQYNQSGIDLYYLDPNDGTIKRALVKEILQLEKKKQRVKFVINENGVTFYPTPNIKRGE